MAVPIGAPGRAIAGPPKTAYNPPAYTPPPMPWNQFGGNGAQGGNTQPGGNSATYNPFAGQQYGVGSPGGIGGAVTGQSDGFMGIGGSSGTPQPALPAYEGIFYGEQAAAAGQQDLANNYKENINNPYGAASRATLGNVTQSYEDTLNGKGPTVAQAQYQQALDQSVATQMGAAGATRGGGAALAGAQRSAQQSGATTQAGAAAQSGIIRAQEQQAARTGLGTLAMQQYTQEQQQALEQQKMQDLMRQYYGQQAMGYENMSSNTLGGYTQANLNAAAIQHGQQQVQFQQGMQTAGTAAAIGSAIAAIA
jgi:hypothetical protein